MFLFVNLLNKKSTQKFSFKHYLIFSWSQAVADLYRISLDGPPPLGQNFFNFMQFLGKFGKIVCWRPLPEGLAPPHQGNPGSATGKGKNFRCKSTLLD